MDQSTQRTWLLFFLSPTAIPCEDRRLFLSWLLPSRTLSSPSSTESLLPYLLPYVSQTYHLHTIFMLLADASLCLLPEEVNWIKEKLEERKNHD